MIGDVQASFLHLFCCLAVKYAALYIININCNIIFHGAWLFYKAQ